MGRELAEYFFEEASRIFAFLMNEHSFSLPTLEIDDQLDFATVSFMGKNVCVECILDVREQDITCKIARVLQGKKAAHFAVDDTGRRVRDHITQILLRRGVRSLPFTKVSGLSLRQRIPITLSDFAQMLKHHARDVLSDSPSAID